MTKQRYNKTRKDVCQEITNNLIASLEKGVLPWRMDWDSSGAAGIPSNAVTGNNYNGMNVLNLWVSAAENGFGSSKWLTYKQAQEAGGQVRKGEKSTVDRKSTRLNSSHVSISYAVFCLKKKTNMKA